MGDNRSGPIAASSERAHIERSIRCFADVRSASAAAAFALTWAIAVDKTRALYDRR
jgi:hypothetical protein